MTYQFMWHIHYVLQSYALCYINGVKQQQQKHQQHNNTTATTTTMTHSYTLSNSTSILQGQKVHTTHSYIYANTYLC